VAAVLIVESIKKLGEKELDAHRELRIGEMEHQH